MWMFGLLCHTSVGKYTVPSFKIISHYSFLCVKLNQAALEGVTPVGDAFLRIVCIRRCLLKSSQ